MKKILYVINTLHGGGAEKVLVETVNGLPRDEWDITVQTIIDKGIYRSALNDNIKYKSIVTVKSQFLSKVFGSLLVRIIPPKLTYNFFVKDQYDYEIAFLEGYPTKLIAASTNKNTKKIAWVHTDLINYPDSYKAFGSEIKEREAYTKFNAVACVSDDVREGFLKKYGNVIPRIQTVYNIVDEKKIIKLSKEECELKSNRPLLVSIGRLIEQKGYDGLLRIVKKLNEKKLNFELWIIGEGAQREQLEDYIKINRLDNVRLLGFRDNPYKYLAKADVFISSSLAEGFSTVITEATLLKVPVISTNTSGAGEPVDNPRCSIVVDGEDELYHAIEQILVDSKKLDELKDCAKRKKNFFTKEHLLYELMCFLTGV